MTGLSPKERTQYNLKGVEVVLLKPVDPELLLEKIKEILLKTS